MKDYVVLGVALLASSASPTAIAANIAPDLTNANTPFSTQLLEARDAAVTQAIALPCVAARTEVGALLSKSNYPNFPKKGGSAGA